MLETFDHPLTLVPPSIYYMTVTAYNSWIIVGHSLTVKMGSALKVISCLCHSPICFSQFASNFKDKYLYDRDPIIELTLMTGPISNLDR